MKRMFALFLSLCMLVAIIPSSFASETKLHNELKYYYGDVNLDGVVNSGDATVILRYCSDMITFTDEQSERGDANQDGVINTADAVYVLKVVADMAEPLACYEEVMDSYTVSYTNSLTDVQVELPAQETIAEGETYTITAEDLKAEGTDYVFNGWKASHNGLLYHKGDSFVMPSYDVTLDATWSVGTTPTGEPTATPTNEPTPTQMPTASPTATPTASPDNKVQLIVGKYPESETATMQINGENTSTGVYTSGTSVTLSFTGNTEKLGAWLINGKTVSTQDSYTLNLTDDTYVVASFMTDTTVTVWSGGANGSFSGGTGKENDPYIITTAEQLAYLAGMPKKQNFYKLANDIYLNTNVLEKVASGNISGLKAWTPIGSDSNNRFYGFFDGNGHTIYGLYIRNASVDAGLFGVTGGGTNQGGINYKNYTQFKNLTVSDAYIKGNQSQMGGIIGRHQAYGHIDNLTFYGKIENGYNYASENMQTGTGGVIGVMETYSCSVTNSRCYGEIMTNYNGQMFGTGGIIGHGSSVWMTVSGCENHAKLTCYGGAAGGIMGYSLTANKIYNSANYGDITHKATGYAFVGGIIGHERAGDSYVGNSEIKGCSNHGDLSACGNSVGGIIGYNYSYNFATNGHIITILGCYNLGIVSTSYTNVNLPLGGILGAGKHASLENCYNAGLVVGGATAQYYGSLMGTADVGSSQTTMCSTSNCYSFSGDCTATYNISTGTILNAGDENTLAVRLGEDYFVNDYEGVNGGYALTVNQPYTEAPSLDIGKSYAIAYVAAYYYEGELVAFNVYEQDAIFTLINEEGVSSWDYNDRTYRPGDAFRMPASDVEFFAA